MTKIDYYVFNGACYEYICSTQQSKTIKGAIAATAKHVGEGKIKPVIGTFNQFDKYLHGNGRIVQTSRTKFANDVYKFKAVIDKE